MLRNEPILSPLVYWAQNNEEIFLKIDLKDGKDVKINLTEKELEFEANGLGATGRNDYGFKLRFYDKIEPENSSHQIHDSRIDIKLRKFILKDSNNNFWPRLISQPQKPHWLKIDFNRWIPNTSNDEMPINDGKFNTDFDKTDTNRSVVDDFPDVMKTLQKEEYGYIKEKSKNVYLIFYNLLQLIGFLYLSIVMGILYFRGGFTGIRNIYKNFNDIIKFLHLIQYLEVLHSFFLYTSGPALNPLIRITGRIFIIFMMIDGEPKMQEQPIVFFLYMIWFCFDLCRYTFYIAKLLKTKIRLLTFIRNKFWIPLYAFGTILEALIILKNIPYFEENKKYQITLPNKYNFTFDMALFMKFYTIGLISMSTYLLINHMAKAQTIKIRPTIIKTRTSKSKD